MKKVLFFAFLFVALFAFTGCDKENPNENEKDPETGTLDNFDAQAFEKNLKVDSFGEDYELPTTVEGIDNSVVTWISSNPTIVSDEGKVIEQFRNKLIKFVMVYTVTVGSESVSNSVEFMIYPFSLDKVAEDFLVQFGSRITSDLDIKTSYYNLYVIEWNSTNKEAFDNNGTYMNPSDDTKTTIEYTVATEDGKYEKSYEKEIVVSSISVQKKINEAYLWLTQEAMTELYLTSKISLPTKYEKYNIPIEWESTAPDVISPSGVVTQYVFERYVTLIGKLSLEDGVKESKFECIVAPLDTSKMSEKEILENFLSAIAVKTYKGIQFGTYANINQSYGFINFYQNVESEITEMLIPEGLKNRTGIKREVKLVVVHDTGNPQNGSTAYANAKYCQNGCSDSSTGWHYTVGNDGIFQTVPDDEVAYHANGEAYTEFEYQPTGIPATAKKPSIYVKDNYVYINQTKTNIKVPKEDVSFASDGILYDIIDGEYWISKFWWCSGHGYNANLGGNANGIGIESAVNPGSDYATTCRKLAKLVAELLIKHNLGINRVVQHNTMSGKDCPMAIRHENFWYSLKDMVSLEKFAKENLSDYQFAWTSNSTIMDNTGQIALDLQGNKSVSYSVDVTKAGNSVGHYDFTTELK